MYQVSPAPTPDPTIAPTKIPSKFNFCFAGTETVQILKTVNGEFISDMKFISEVKVGDKILSADNHGTLSYSEVVYIPHAANTIHTVFQHITTAAGRDIKLTPQHMISAGTCRDNMRVTDPFHTVRLMQSDLVTLGMCVHTVAGEERVVHTQQVKGYGIFSVVVKQPYIVVNGIIASPFAFNHAVTHAYYNVHRVIYDAFPSLLKNGMLKNALKLFADLSVSVSI